MNKFLVASTLLMASLSAFAQEKSSLEDTSQKIIPLVSPKVDDVNFKVNIELYQEENNIKKVILSLNGLAKNNQKISFSNVKSTKYISSITKEETNDLTTQEIKMETSYNPKPQFIVNTSELLTGYNGFISPSTLKDKTIVNFSFENIDLVEIKKFTSDEQSIELPTTNQFSILQSRDVKLDLPTIIALKDGMKMKVIINKI